MFIRVQLVSLKNPGTVGVIPTGHPVQAEDDVELFALYSAESMLSTFMLTKIRTQLKIVCSKIRPGVRWTAIPPCRE